MTPHALRIWRWMVLLTAVLSAPFASWADVLKEGDGSAPGPTAFASFGVEVTSPPGWVRTTEHRYSQVGRWMRAEEGVRPGLGPAALVVELDRFPRKGRTAEQMAELLAKAAGGEAAKSQRTILGTSSWSVTSTKPAGGGFYLHQQLVAEQGDAVFAVTLYGPKDLNAKHLNDFDSFAASLKPRNLVEPRDDLVLDMRAGSLLRSGYMVKLPEPMRPDAVKDPKAEGFYGIDNYVKKRSELALTVARREKSADVEVADVAEQMRQNLQTSFDLKEPLKITRVRANPDVYLTSVFPTQEGSKGVSKLNAAAFFASAPNQLIFLTYQYPSDDEAAAAAYSDLIRKMVASIYYSEEYLDGAKEGRRQWQEGEQKSP